MDDLVAQILPDKWLTSAQCIPESLSGVIQFMLPEESPKMNKGMHIQISKWIISLTKSKQWWLCLGFLLNITSKFSIHATLNFYPLFYYKHLSYKRSAHRTVTKILLALSSLETHFENKLRLAFLAVFQFVYKISLIIWWQFFLTTWLAF